MNDPRIRAAHRAALDHVLGLVVDLPWGDSLVLRGSMLMRAWLGNRAREPADLDFVVLPDLAVPIDPLDPHPYVVGYDVVQQWPEVADGAARYEIWHDGDDEFETRGARAIVPPEGLHWETDCSRAESISEYCNDLREQVRRHPNVAPDVLLDADGIRFDDSWTYSYSSKDGGPGGIRIVVPWRIPDVHGGEIQVDFALDERLPEAPIWALIPCANGDEVLVQAVSRELSLAWKLEWIRRDDTAEGGPRLKDLHDAILLAAELAAGPGVSPRDSGPGGRSQLSAT